nr:hypothetical protein [Deltaproteobacteria bacterium]
MHEPERWEAGGIAFSAITYSSFYELARLKATSIAEGDSILETALIGALSNGIYSANPVRIVLSTAYRNAISRTQRHWEGMRDEALTTLREASARSWQGFGDSLPDAAALGRWMCESDGRTRSRFRGSLIDRDVCLTTCVDQFTGTGAYCRAPLRQVVRLASAPSTDPAETRLDVVYPDGHSFARGERVAIRWVGRAIDGSVRVTVVRSGSEIATVEGSGASSGSAEWQVPLDAISSATYEGLRGLGGCPRLLSLPSRARRSARDLRGEPGGTDLRRRRRHSGDLDGRGCQRAAATCRPARRRGSRGAVDPTPAGGLPLGDCSVCLGHRPGIPALRHHERTRSDWVWIVLDRSDSGTLPAR